MALFTPGPMIGQISGRIGGQIFSRNQGGAYIRTGSIPVNPQTPQQMFTRSLISTFAAQWQVLDQTVRDAWDAWAQEVQHGEYTNRLGLSQGLSGQQTYIRLNVALAYAGLTAIVNPPSGEAPAEPALPPDVIIAAEIDEGISLLLTALTGGTVTAGASLHWQIGITTPRGPGRMRYQTRELRLVATGAANGTFAAALTAAQAGYVSRYGLPAVGTRLGFGSRVIDADTGGTSAWRTFPFADVTEV